MKGTPKGLSENMKTSNQRRMYAVFATSVCAMAFASCSGGGGGSTPPSTIPVVPVTPAPAAPTSAPSAAPKSSGRAVAFSVASAGQKVVTASNARRAAAGTVQSEPAIVESIGQYNSGTGANVWEYDTTTGQPVLDGTPTVTSNDALTTTDPVVPVTTAGWTDAFSAGVNPVSVGLSSVTVAFTSASGTLPVYIYDGWSATCSFATNPFPAYVMNGSGVFTPTTNTATADMVVDCTNPSNPTLTFPRGAAIEAQPVLDTYGEYNSAFTTYLTAPTVTSSPLTIAQQTAQPGQIVAFNDANGRVSKLMWVTNPEASYWSGYAMESNVGGAFAY